MIVNRAVFTYGTWSHFGYPALFLIVVSAVYAQDSGHAADHTGMVEMNPAGMFLMNLSSGTSENPASWPMPMVMMHFAKWNTMFMGTAFLVDTQQSGPRGGDKLYAPNWVMASAQRRAGSKGS